MLPRSGPLPSQIEADGSDDGVSGLVVALNAAIASRIPQPGPDRFPPAFVAERPIETHRLGPGDELDLLIWEPGGLGVFGAGVGDGAGRIAGIRIEPDGALFVPFAGAVRAAGSTPGELRDRLRRALAPYTADPQIDLRLIQAHSRTVTLQGAVARPGAYVIEAASTRLLPMLAMAGGATAAPERLEIRLRRGDVTGFATLDAVYADPALDVALRPGDLIVAQPLRERFIVLGATAVQAEVPFPARPLSLLAAIGTVGGLRDNDADPTGVFLFRREDRTLADALLPAPEPEGLPAGEGRPIIYRLDLTGRGALFAAQTFKLRDGDALFVTNSPLTEIRKVVQLFTASVAPIQTTTRLTD